MSNTIEQLELEIVSNSKGAVDGIDALTQSLEKLKSATKGGLGLTKVAKETGKLNESLSKLGSANNKTAGSFIDLYHKMKLGVNIIKRVASSLGTAINKSNDYVENMNLFTVSMGAYSAEALEYAETVSDAMGIDTSEWIRAQGVFMTMATGFGVASDRAATMSKNLTQLGYDLSSFYNIDIETAMLKLKSGLAGELEPLRAIGYDLSQAKLEATAAALGITKSVDAMTQAEKAQLRYYAIMTQVTVAQGDMARTLDDPANQLRVLKAQLSMAAREIGNIFIPALKSILPYAIAVVKVLGILASTIAGLFGYEAPQIDESIAGAAEYAGEVADGLGDAQKEAKKLKSYMMGFDELNVINPNTSGEASGLGEFDFKLPEYDFLGELVESDVNQIVNDIQKALDDIGMIVSAATLAVGAVLTFTGVNLPLGVSLMALGAYTLATQVAVNWKSIENPVRTTLGILEGIVGGGLLALGGILAFTGVNVPLGVALMAMGAVSLVTAVALNWEGLNKSVKETIGTLTGIVGASLLAIGGMLAFSGANIPLGIALIGSGAVSLVSAATLNWESLTDDVESCVETIGMVISGALLVLGAILAFTGANVPLGVALLTTGALSLGTTLALNTNALSDEVKGVMAVITSAVSISLLAVGAILATTGANLPLGIALMAGGALALGTAIAPNWNELSDEVKTQISNIAGALGAALLVVGGIFAFSGANIPLGIGLMLVGATSLGASVALNWNIIKEKLQTPVGGVTALVSGALVALGAILAFSSANIPLGIALMAAGAVGLATVIAVNWDAITDKLEPVIASILGILSGAMLVLGVLLCLSGVGIGLGLALIFGALKLTETAWKLDDNPITSFVKNMANGIVNIINKVIDAINDMFHIEFSGLVIGGVEIIPSFDKRLINIPKIPLMAEGGFPEQGQMFIAREAGAEMVGSIGRRTAVANNEQIVAGIAGGVAQANEEQNALIREQNSLLRALLEKDNGVYLDGKNLTDSVEKYQRERGRVLIAGGVV